MHKVNLLARRTGDFRANALTEKMIRDEIAQWGPVVTKADIKP